MQRLLLLRVTLLIGLVVLIGRLYQLQLLDTTLWTYRNTVEENTTRYVAVQPRRGEILASDGATLLAESVPHFRVAVLAGSLPPRSSQQRARILGNLAQVTELTGTLVLSPVQALEHQPALYRDLVPLVGAPALDMYINQNQGQNGGHEPAQFDVAPEHMLDAIDVSQTYSSTLVFENEIERLLEQSSSRHYQSVIIKDDISQELALAIQENTRHLPGVSVIKTYQRRYPQSAAIPSFSHLLGYIGRINECELVTENAAASWSDGLMDALGHIPTCGVVEKRVDPETLVISAYQNDDHIGKDGLEAGYESELRGELGVETVLVDALERPVSFHRTLKPVLEGYNVILTIDAAFQHQTEQILRRWLAEADRRRQEAEEAYKQSYKPITNGVIIVMDPRDGRILASVSLPAYDNNVWVNPDQGDELQHLLSPVDPAEREELERLSPLTNRAIAGQYPPGSSLKQFIGATALQKGIIEPGTRLRDPGKIVLRERGGHTFTLPNSDPKDNGEITISDALMVSSNVFFASIAGGNEQAINLDPDSLIIEGLTTQGVSEGLEWFRFGLPTTIRLPGEATGRVPDPIWKSHTLREPWTTGDTYNTVIGQGYLEVTPLQLITAAAAVANGGTIYRPQLMQRITDGSTTVVSEMTPEILTTVPIDPAYLAVVREGMRRSVTEGLNVAARDSCSGLSIAGKTGTAEFGPLILTEDDSFARRSHSWFVGFAPYDNPELLVVALLEGTGDLEDGSATLAVPVVTQVMQAYFGVTPPTEPPGDCPWLPR